MNIIPFNKIFIGEINGPELILTFLIDGKEYADSIDLTDLEDLQKEIKNMYDKNSTIQSFHQLTKHHEMLDKIEELMYDQNGWESNQFGYYPPEYVLENIQ